MMQFTSVIVLLRIIAIASAFTVHRKTMCLRVSKTIVNYHPDTFDRAVECANTYGLCSVDELLNLAQDLQNYQGCFYENGSEEACRKEAEDRVDVSNLLLLQGEMQERMHYFKEGNLFAFDVQADRDMHDRDHFIDKIAPGLDI